MIKRVSKPNQELYTKSDLLFEIYYEAIQLELNLLNSRYLNSNWKNEFNLHDNSLKLNYQNSLNELKKISDQIVNNFIDLSELLLKEIINGQNIKDKFQQKESTEITSFIKKQIQIAIRISKCFNQLMIGKSEIPEPFPQTNKLNFQFNHKDLILPWWLSKSV